MIEDAAMTETLSAEELWQRAHELVRRGDFANAVRDLALCYQMLQARQDPRLYEVHKRWTEVHQLYLEDGARQSEPPAQSSPSVEAEAEAAANAGDLERAIALYEQAAAQQPGNELVRERLGELRFARARAAELSSPPVATPASPSARAEDDWSDVAIESSPEQRAATDVAIDMASDVPAAQGPAAQEPAAVTVTPATVTPATAAPAMAPEDAPVGMQSLDVPFSVGDAIEASQADELPVVGGATTPPGPADDVAFLEQLLARVQANRRPAA